MQKNLTIILVILLYSCGGDEPTSPQIIDYYSEDNQFLEELSSSNGKTVEYLSDFIENVLFDSSGSKFYRIKKMYFSSMGLDSLPASIGKLDSLTILTLNDNKLKFIPESICSIFENLDSLAVDNNEICTPALPTCIKNTTTIAFYDSQYCEIGYDEEDEDFINQLIIENWGEDSLSFLFDQFNNLTNWDTFEETIENNLILVSRITEIRYDGRDITKIPDEIAELDMLNRLEIQDNQIEIIPDFIGSLLNLTYFTINDNKIGVIPGTIGNLINLEVFKISKNLLNSIPEAIGGLVNLEKLWLSDNLLTSLPDGMCAILENCGINIYIQNNQLCADSSNKCFEDLITSSTQPLNACD